jgi:hypothetical protein
MNQTHPRWCHHRRPLHPNASVRSDSRFLGRYQDEHREWRSYPRHCQILISRQPDGDSGGELDPHGAENVGNPIGGNVTSNVPTGSDVFYEEWMSFVSDHQILHVHRARADGVSDLVRPVLSPNLHCSERQRYHCPAV